MPLTTTRPRQPRTSSTARRKRPSSRSTSAATACDSVISTSRASASAELREASVALGAFRGSTGFKRLPKDVQPARHALQQLCESICAIVTAAWPMILWAFEAGTGLAAARPIMPSVLELTLLLLAASVLAVTALRVLNLPPVLAYLLVGIAVGPHALALAPDSRAT